MDPNVKQPASTILPSPPPPPPGYGVPQLPTPPPGYGVPTQPPAGWPGSLPPGYGMPVADRRPTMLARIGALLLVTFGALEALFAGFVIVTGKVASEAPEDFTGPIIPDDLVPILSVIFLGLFVVGLVEIATGVFAWRGHGWARALGIVFGVFFGVLGLLELVVGLPLGPGGFYVLQGALFAAANFFIAAALGYFWRPGRAARSA